MSSGTKYPKYSKTFLKIDDGETFLFTSESVGEGHPGNNNDIKICKITYTLCFFLLRVHERDFFLLLEEISKILYEKMLLNKYYLLLFLDISVI